MRAARVVSLAALAALAMALALQPAWAQTSPIAFTATPQSGGATQYSVPVQTLLALTALGFLPALSHFACPISEWV